MTAPRLAVYRHVVLPASETFVKNQIESFDRFDAKLFGIERDPALTVDAPSFVLGEGSVPGAAGRVALFKARRTSGALRRAIQAFSPDLLLAQFAQDAWRILPTARAARVPVVVGCHGSDVLSTDAYASTAERSMRQLVGHWGDLSEAALAFLAPSEFVRDALIARGVPASKVHVRHLGTAIPPIESNGEQERAGLLFVGRLVPNKGVDDLLRAHATAVRAVPGLRLTVVGDGPEARSLHVLAGELGTSKLVTFAGTQPPAAVDVAMRSHAVLAAPSKPAPSGASEGFGLVTIEAAARQLPVVAYATGGLPEAVGTGADSGGALVPTGDIDELAAAIVRVVTDPIHAEELGRRGRARTEQLFDVHACTAAIEDTLLELAGLR